MQTRYDADEIYRPGLYLIVPPNGYKQQPYEESFKEIGKVPILVESQFLDEPSTIENAVLFVNFSRQSLTFVVDYVDDKGARSPVPIDTERFQDKEKGGDILTTGSAGHVPVSPNCFTLSFESHCGHIESDEALILATLEDQIVTVVKTKEGFKVAQKPGDSASLKGRTKVVNSTVHEVTFQVRKQEHAWGQSNEKLRQVAHEGVDRGTKPIVNRKISGGAKFLYDYQPERFIIRALEPERDEVDGSLENEITPLDAYEEFDEVEAFVGQIIVAYNHPTSTKDIDLRVYNSNEVILVSDKLSSRGPAGQ